MASEPSIGSGPDTDISALSSGMLSRDISIAQGPIKYSFCVSPLLYNSAVVLVDQFMFSDRHTSESKSKISSMYLLARFLDFLAEKIEDNQPDFNTTQAKLLDTVLTRFEEDFLHDNDIHAVVHDQEEGGASSSFIIKSYVRARSLLDRPGSLKRSNLLQAVSNGSAKLYTVFGGQGTDEKYFDDIRELYTTYQPIVEDLVISTRVLLSNLACQSKYEHHYLRGVNICDWITNPGLQPEIDYLVSAPISFPLIGLLQLMQYKATVHQLGYEPKEMHQLIAGTTGHSQGIICAAVIAAADSWERYDKLSVDAITVLAFIGLLSQEAFPATTSSDIALAKGDSDSQEAPTCMLSVRELPLSAIEEIVHSLNCNLPQSSRLEVSLINGSHNIVVSGPPASLCGLTSQFRSMKSCGSQTKLPFSKRLPTINYSFLSITAPFHSSYLAEVPSALSKLLEHISISGGDLQIPVYSTKDGSDLRVKKAINIVPELIRMITVDRLAWLQATKFPGATHIVDFGPGGRSGIGSVIRKNTDGSGVRIILAGVREPGNQNLGSQNELFDRVVGQPIRGGNDWVARYAPHLVKTLAGQVFVDTTMSRLLGLPPVMVAAMTPTTASTDFVIATMKAGYHVELAAGGYNNAESLNIAINNVIEHAPPGRGLAINVIYANPRALSWQITLIARLTSEGIPIEGLTIGAGVPSLEVASHYIKDLGLKYVAFKPGSVDGINQVIAIAKAHPGFPIMVQWTGGRGGGHHSFEDFHQPMLQMYSHLRSCPNVVLVAGSGFGTCESSYPYLTGEWSEIFGRSRMPFDGILVGSRVMTALEAKTSPAVKQAIVDTPGLDDASWEKTYDGSYGGIISVKSEMGEPIHKLATRAVKLWYELDNTVFNLTTAKRLEVLQRKRSYIIKRLNEDFSKVWFGKDARTGEVANLEDMIYRDVVMRLVELTYVADEHRWIDSSYQQLVYDFCTAIEARYTTVHKGRFHFNSPDSLKLPHDALKEYFDAVPQLSKDLISFEDSQLFIQMCRRSGQKPVPFIIALDEDFEYWFKKDSLWQSEDLRAVIGQDVGRVCVLQGPVSVRYSSKVNEPVKDILDEINHGFIANLKSRMDGDHTRTVPALECFGLKPIVSDGIITARDFIVYREHEDCMIYEVSPQAELSQMDQNVWLSTISGSGNDWRNALFESKTVRRGLKMVSNPVLRLFAAQPGCFVCVNDLSGLDGPTVTYFEAGKDGNPVRTVEVSAKANIITLEIIEHRTFSGDPESLKLLYKFTPTCGFNPLHELHENRNLCTKNFYHRLWFGHNFTNQYSVHDEFTAEEFVVTSDNVAKFTRCVGNSNGAFVKRVGKSSFGPLDLAVVISWKALMKPLFCAEIDGDLLHLLHLSNSFRMRPAVRPFQINDVLTTRTNVTAVVNQKAGKMIEVAGQIFRDGKPILDIKSQFLYRGVYTDFENTFQRIEEDPVEVCFEHPKDIMVLKSKSWFRMIDPNTSLDHSTLVFRPETLYKFQSSEIFSMVKVRGNVELRSSSDQTTKIGTIQYDAGVSHGNPVVEYLKRHSQQSKGRMLFEKAIPLNRIAQVIRAPESNEMYGRVSGDFNPIHVSRAFAACTGLPGTIVHGMWTSAKVRGLVEKSVCSDAVGLFRSWRCTFMDMVLPKDELEVKFEHIGMANGLKILLVTATNRESGNIVLQGECEIAPPKTAYLFSGQGSQQKGMGMDLYRESAVARSIWDHADTYFWETYGKLLFLALDQTCLTHTL